MRPAASAAPLAYAAGLRRWLTPLA